MTYLKNKWPFLLFFSIIFVIFSPFFLQGKIPLPADALVGLYHPYRDLLKSDYQNGYPYKNPLITDPVLQQYPYRFLAVQQIKSGKFPGWNPYAFSGTPLFANIQTALLNPFNFILFLLPFEFGWAILIILQPILAFFGMYFFLRQLSLKKSAAFLGGLSFSFCGFIVSWLEWGTLGFTAALLPWILYFLEKFVSSQKKRDAVILALSIISVLFSGHLQTALYVLAFTVLYFFHLFFLSQKEKKFELKKLKLFAPLLVVLVCVGIISFVQLKPVFTFISQSARDTDLNSWQRNDWFIPYNHLVQFLIPDFFGNPATLNYWGEWNYGEFVGYFGMVPFLFALYAVCFRSDKKTIWFKLMLLVSLLFGLNTIVGRIPFILNIPLISTLQPSRIMVLIDFNLSILAAFGFDYFLQKKDRDSFVGNSLKDKISSILKNQFIWILGVLFIIFIVIWLSILKKLQIQVPEVFEHFSIAKRNAILPTIIFVCSAVIFKIFIITKNRKVQYLLISLIFLVTIFDQYRFVTKFIPFSDRKLIYPQTSTIQFLQDNLKNHRFITTNREVLPPNISTYYKIQSVDGYDPLYLKNYGNIVASWTRQKPDISPASFNRILTPQMPNSFFTNLLGVKYIVSKYPLNFPQMKLVHEEGDTKIYENLNVFPRSWLIEEVLRVEDVQKEFQWMFDHATDLSKTGVSSQFSFKSQRLLTADDRVESLNYSENTIEITVEAKEERVLVLSDLYYPGWIATINGNTQSIFSLNGGLRGVQVPQGKSKVIFNYNPF